MSRVDFFYSIGSRYSYLASSQLTALAADTGCTIEWRPLDSVRLLASRGVSPFEGPPVSGQYDGSYRQTDCERWASFYGVPFVEPRGRVAFDPELLALACTAAGSLGGIEPYSHELFAAMFTGSVSRVDEEECIRRAASAGLQVERFRRELHADHTRQRLDAEIDAALRSGVFGVPSFMVDGELFWGNDRLALLRSHLVRASAT